MEVPLGLIKNTKLPIQYILGQEFRKLIQIKHIISSNQYCVKLQSCIYAFTDKHDLKGTERKRVFLIAFNNV